MVSVVGMFTSAGLFLFKVLKAFYILFTPNIDKEIEEKKLQIKNALDVKHGYCCVGFERIQDAIEYCGCATKTENGDWVCPFTGKNIGNKWYCKSKDYNSCKIRCSHVRNYYRNIYKNI